MSLPKPYYEDTKSGIVIYHGDCREILPELPKADLVLTDPPYGISYIARSLGASEKRTGRTQYEGVGVVGDDQPFDPHSIISINAHAILWGANHYADKLPPISSWLIWDKRGDPKFYGKTTFSDCEMAWFSKGGPARMYRQIWNGIVREGEDSAKAGTGRVHPTQKPTELMRWCIGLVPECTMVLDPYMGSGPVLKAAKDLGKKAIGIEIEEKYAEIAAKRLSQEVLPLDFTEPPKPEALDLGIGE